MGVAEPDHGLPVHLAQASARREQHAEVEIPAAQQGQQLRRARHLHFHRDARMALREIRESPRQQRIRQILHRAEAHRTFQPLARHRQRRALAGLQHRAGVGQQRLARHGEKQIAPALAEERTSHQRGQPGHLQADRGRRQADRARRVQQRIGERFCARASVAPDDDRGALAEPERFDHGAREALELVGHDAPRDAGFVEAIEERLHAREEPRVDAEIAAVDLEELVAHRREIGVLRRDLEGR